MRTCLVMATTATLSLLSVSAMADAPDRESATKTQEVDFAAEAGLVSWLDQARTLNFATDKMAPSVDRISPEARLRQLELRWNISKAKAHKADGIWASQLERELEALRVLVQGLDDSDEGSRRERRTLKRRIDRLERSIDFARRIRASVDFVQA